MRPYHDIRTSLPIASLFPGAKCANAATRLLEQFAESNGQLTLPVPIETIVISLGFQVVHLYTAGDEFSGLVSPRQKLIGINGHHHRHRQRFTLAHEISHVLLKHPPESHCRIGQIAQFNSEADACASELLVPTPLFTPWYPKTKNLKTLALLFDVSQEVMKRRVEVFEQGMDRFC